MEEKRQINSESELVNALCKGVAVEYYANDNDKRMVYCDEKPSVYLRLLEVDTIKNGVSFRYSEPVEVVELWGNKYWYNDLRVKSDTHKQTQIHQNGQIIWCETVEV